MNCRMFESHGEFAKDYIDAAIAAIARGDSKDASFCLDMLAEKLEAMRKELGFVGY